MRVVSAGCSLTAFLPISRTAAQPSLVIGYGLGERPVREPDHGPTPVESSCGRQKLPLRQNADGSAIRPGAFEIDPENE